MSRSVAPERTPCVQGDVAYVPLTRGHTAIIDAADAEMVGQWAWYAAGRADRPYAARNSFDGGNRAIIMMHRVLLNAPDHIYVDHIDGNPLNNRRCNLRLATKAENNRNVSMRRDNTSGFKGVSRVSEGNKWMAKIGVNGRQIFLGRFDTAEQAHEAYCAAAVLHFGDFANPGICKGHSL